MALGIMALGVSALARAQVNGNEVEASTVLGTARIIRVRPEMNQLNELVRNQSDVSKITPIHQVIVAFSPLR